MSFSLETSKNPIFVFGISGATWKVIEPLITDGTLPNLNLLIENGCSATLRSCKAIGDKHYRPQTAWPTIATGVAPEQHGITRFWHTATDQRVRNLWDYYLDRGDTIGLYGWPITWPPRKVQGFIIPCHHARDSQTWPPELAAIKMLDRWQQSVERQVQPTKQWRSYFQIVNFLISKGVIYRGLPRYIRLGFKLMACINAEERSLVMRQVKLELGTDLFVHLYKKHKPAFSAFVTFLVDFSSHRYWRYFEPEKFTVSSRYSTARLTNAVKEAYQDADRQLGRILKVLPKTAIVAIVSEHGMAAETVSAEAGDQRFIIKGSHLAEFIGLGEMIYACPVARWIAFRAKEDCILPSDTVERLNDVKVVETGLPLFQVYRHGQEEVIVKFKINSQDPRYNQGFLDRLHIEYRGKKASFSKIAREMGASRSAMHDQYGVFVIKGPGIRKNVRMPDVDLVDVAPTLLRCSGIPYDSHLTGDVLNIFSK